MYHIYILNCRRVLVVALFLLRGRVQSNKFYLRIILNRMQWHRSMDTISIKGGMKASYERYVNSRFRIFKDWGDT